MYRYAVCVRTNIKDCRLLTRRDAYLPSVLFHVCSSSLHEIKSRLPPSTTIPLSNIATMSPRNSLAIVQVVVHSGIVVPIGLYLWTKEGWRRFEWMLVSVLASIRITGSVLQLVDDAGPPNKSIVIVNGIGLSPLMGIILMLVHRLYA
jgi:hypothetical protein